MPRTGLNPTELKERALDAAQQRICRDGFDRVRLADIARDLSISHVALYKHFPDKAALLDAVTSRWLHSLHTDLEKVVYGDQNVGVRLPAWFRKYHFLIQEKSRRDPQLFGAFISAWENKTPSANFHHDTIQSQLEIMVQEAMEIGLLRQNDPIPTARLLLETTISFHHPRLISENSEENRESALRRVLETVLQGLA
jgi:AcrR family transcriptional regulator